MKRLIFILPFLFLGLRSMAQDSDTLDIGDTPEEMIYEDELQDVSYRQNDMFRILDTPRGEIGIHALYMPLFGRPAFGGGFEIGMAYTQNLKAGLSLNFAVKKVREDFGYIVGDPKLTWIDISLYNQMDLLQWRGLDLGVRLNTGLSVWRLADDSIKEVYTWYDEYGIAYESERAVTVDRNYFFRIAPEAIARYHVARNFSLEAGAAYNFYLGGAGFGHSRDFRNYMIRFGARFDF